jgi:hypothetical protein
MAYAAISKPSLHFNTKIYTGNAGTQSITGVGFQPDLVWTKARNLGAYHMWTDVVRGATKIIQSNTSTAEQTFATGLTSFDSDGFTAGNSDDINGNYNYASWNWKAGTGQGSSNTDGSTNTTYTSVNTTAGFSISTYAGSGSLATVGHGLGAAPEVVLIKSTSHAENWVMYHKSIGAGKYLYLNNSDAAGPNSGTNTSIFNNTAPTNSVFTVNTDGTSNGSGKNYVAYCFAEKKGYSKFGSYTGNGNADGTFVYTGFKPAWVLTKETPNTSSWDMHDNKRDPHNVCNKYLLAEDGGAEGTTDILDFCSNGFKFRTTNGDRNQSGVTYIFMAFAEEPLVANVGQSIPATAR